MRQDKDIQLRQFLNLEGIWGLAILSKLPSCPDNLRPRHIQLLSESEVSAPVCDILDGWKRNIEIRGA